MFSTDQQQRIAAAIATSERGTSGEIVAVVAAASDSYFYVPLLLAAAVALILPWPLIYLTWWTIQAIVSLQLAVFVGVAAIAMWPRLRYALVPGSIKRHHAHRRAVEQFLAQNLHTTRGRTGVLIFVSVAERYAEIIADIEIYRKVPRETWQQIVDALTARIGAKQATEGFVDAVTKAGALLAEHFPPGSADADELPNHLILLA